MKKDPCKPFACNIQKCLTEHNFQESSCAVEIEELRQCCQLWREKSLVCSGIDVTPPEAAPPNKKPSAAGSSKQ
ncbi:hypothetical protein R5R35_000369 [Gryllus longicercus]|uniref:Cx9C motif-containing protein 4 n=1 Tax=Gryllus longicercus TaxID=2509291 RepID=A0AAN9Z983_9ORTH